MSAYQLLLILVFVALLVILIGLFLPTPGSRAKPGPSVPRGGGGEPIDRDDDRHWLGGVLYNNPDDPDPLVPRRFGWGWTVNFGHPFGKVVLLVMLGLVLLPVVIALVEPGFAATGCHPSNCQPLP